MSIIYGKKRTLMRFFNRYTVGTYGLITVLAAISALNYSIFIFPNSFAPAGLDGICTMIQYLFHIRFGYLALICNIPLLAAAYFVLSPEFVRKTAVYVLAFSAFSVLYAQADVSAFGYHTENGTSTVLAPVIAGVIRGVLYALTLRTGATSGGIDIVASLVRHARPGFGFMNTVLILNGFVALLAFFVYGFQMEPVICSLLYAYLTTAVSKRFSEWMRHVRSAARANESANTLRS